MKNYSLTVIKKITEVPKARLNNSDAVERNHELRGALLNLLQTLKKGQSFIVKGRSMTELKSILVGIKLTYAIDTLYTIRSLSNDRLGVWIDRENTSGDVQKLRPRRNRSRSKMRPILDAE